MAHSFNIFNWANDDATMAISIDSPDLRQLVADCTQPDAGDTWTSLEAFIQAADSAAEEPPEPFIRPVDVVWMNTTGYGTPRYFPERIFRATYSGRVRESGGYAVRGYCIVDPAGYPILSPHHRSPVTAEYIATSIRDVIVVLP